MSVTPKWQPNSSLGSRFSRGEGAGLHLRASVVLRAVEPTVNLRRLKKSHGSRLRRPRRATGTGRSDGSRSRNTQERIDPRLKAAGWVVVPADSLERASAAPVAVQEFDTPNGPADYALFDGPRCSRVAEAKKLSLGPQGVLVQAERYSRAIDQTPRCQGEFGAPFLYATRSSMRQTARCFGSTTSATR